MSAVESDSFVSYFFKVRVLRFFNFKLKFKMGYKGRCPLTKAPQGDLYNYKDSILK